MALTLFIIATLLTAFLLLRLRIRFDLSEQQRRLFVGLGRSGLEFDLKNHERHLKLMGLSVRHSPTRSAAPSPPTKPPRSRLPQGVDWGNMSTHLPQILRACFAFLRGSWKSTRIEQCEGELRGGFGSPDLTGQMFGFYLALASAIPGGSRFRFVPLWYASPFTGQIQVAVAMPLYALIYRFCVLMIQLPKRALLRTALHKKKGIRNG